MVRVLYFQHFDLPNLIVKKCIQKQPCLHGTSPNVAAKHTKTWNVIKQKHVVWCILVEMPFRKTRHHGKILKRILKRLGQERPREDVDLAIGRHSEMLEQLGNSKLYIVWFHSCAIHSYISNHSWCLQRLMYLFAVCGQFGCCLMLLVYCDVFVLISLCFVLIFLSPSICKHFLHLIKKISQECYGLLMDKCQWGSTWLPQCQWHVFGANLHHCGLTSLSSSSSSRWSMTHNKQKPLCCDKCSNGSLLFLGLA